jgi:hypothetical protein
VRARGGSCCTTVSEGPRRASPAREYRVPKPEAVSRDSQGLTDRAHEAVSAVASVSGQARQEPGTHFPLWRNGTRWDPIIQGPRGRPPTSGKGNLPTNAEAFPSSPRGDFVDIVCLILRVTPSAGNDRTTASGCRGWPRISRAAEPQIDLIHSLHRAWSPA